MNRETLQVWVKEALKYYKGGASIVLVSKYIWDNYELELRNYPQFFYSWQYEIRWAVKTLRDKSIIKPASESPRGIWELAYNDFNHSLENEVNRQIEPFVPIVCEKQCVLGDLLCESVYSEAKNNNSNLIHYIAGTAKAIGSDKKTSAKKDIDYVKSLLKEVKHLTITDPYFFQFDKSIYRTRDEYLELISNILPNGLKKLEVFHLVGPDSHLIKPFKKYCHDNQIQFTNYGTQEIHDRVLIKDGAIAKILGTSFGGLGNKLAFILDLPDEDLREFKSQLNRIKNAHRILRT